MGSRIRTLIPCRSKVLAALVFLFLIVSGRPVLALEVTFNAPGAPDSLDKDLRAASALMSADRSGLTSPQEIFAAALSDYRTLLQVLYDAGHFGPVIHVHLDGREAAGIPPINPPRKISKVDITIDPGPAFRFGLARVAPLAAGTTLPENFARGRPAGTGTIRQAAIAGRDGWRALGHAKAAIGGQRIAARHKTAELDADIRLIPGNVLRFGAMKVTGNIRVRETAIRQIAGFPAGQTYSPQDLRKVAARLRRTGTFSSVLIAEHDRENPDGTLDFTADITELPLRRITFGASVESQAGMTLSAIWLHRNLFGNAERFRVEGQLRNIGGDQDIDGRIAFRLDNPARLGPDNNLFYRGSIERLEREHYDIERTSLGIGVRRQNTDDLFVEAAIDLSSSDTSDVFGKRRFELVSLPLRAQLDRRDSEYDPTRGYFVDLRVTPFTGINGAASGIAAHLDGRIYRPLSDSGRFVAAARLQIGSVVGPKLAETSPEFLFFSGGAGTVRGHSFQSLGIPVGTGVAGGRAIVNASAELRARVGTALSLVGFFDFGAVDDGSYVTGDSRKHAGAGIGVRYDLGAFGPVRLDLAYPVNGSKDDGLQFYIGIGQAF